MCGKNVWCGLVVLVLGILLLLQDLGTIAWFIINPWTLVFLIVGACMVCRSCCKSKPEPKKK